MSGALTTAMTVALFAVMALRPPMPRHSSPFNLQFALAWIINEQPFLGLLWLASGATGVLVQPELGWITWWLVAVISAVDVVALARIAWRTRSARPVLSAALVDAFGDGAAPRPTRRPWWRIIVLPVVSWRPDVRRIRNRRYGPHGRGNRLDIYVSRRRRPPDAPVFIYLHGGGFTMGSKLLGARPLIYRLAAQGWVCVSVDYRLSRVGYADQLADARSAIAWTRSHARAYGGDPGTVFIAGGSAGAHLAATAALLGTEATGVVGLYGYYGRVGGSGPGPKSPEECIRPDAPPFLIIHGALDTLVLSSDARRFAGRLDAVSRRPVVFAELPGTHHNFDFFHSLRCHAVTDAVVEFMRLTSEEGNKDNQLAQYPSAG